MHILYKIICLPLPSILLPEKLRHSEVENATCCRLSQPFVFQVKRNISYDELQDELLKQITDNPAYRLNGTRQQVCVLLISGRSVLNSSGVVFL